jgi:hypothetical protein
MLPVMNCLRLVPILVLFACDCTDPVLCTSGGRTFDVGDTFNDGCNDCTCLPSGMPSCTKRACVDGGPPRDAAFDSGRLDAGSDGGDDAATDAGLDANVTCATTESSTLDGVHIVFPAQDCVFTLAEAAAGVAIQYDVEIEGAPAMVQTRREPSQGCGAPGPSGLFVFEELGGGAEHYCRCDEGRCAPTSVASAPVEGTHRESFMWLGRNWSGPSDFGAPMGDPFPAGRYLLTVSSVGTAGGDEYRVEGTFEIELTP